MSKRIRSLFDAFSGDPRPSQADALPEIEDAVREFDVVVIDAPVAAGKSKLAEAIARWSTSADGGLGSAGIGVPSNALLDQYERGINTPGWVYLRRKDSYQCREKNGPHERSCQDRRAAVGGFCKSHGGNRWASDSCPWVRDLASVRGKRGKFATTWHGWMAHSLAPAISIQDEAHGLVDFLSELGARRLWRSKYRWPVEIDSSAQIERWVDSLPSEDIDADPLLQQLRSVLARETTDVRLSWGEGEYFGKPCDFISLAPMTGGRAPPVLWPPKTQKIVLMSATLSEMDLEDMGLAERRVKWVRMKSEIPEENRPFVLLPRWDSRYDRRDLDALRAGVCEVLDAHPGQRGVIHATYAVADELRTLTAAQPRLMFHNGPHDKRRAIDDFLYHSDLDAVLVISGQYEGLDLADDRARFQILTAAPRQSLSDQSLRWLADNDPRRYEWLTVRDLAQAYGRVCRGPSDFGVTVCLDASAARELRSNQVPAWMRGAIQDEG